MIPTFNWSYCWKSSVSFFKRFDRLLDDEDFLTCLKAALGCLPSIADLFNGSWFHLFPAILWILNPLSASVALNFYMRAILALNGLIHFIISFMVTSMKWLNSCIISRKHVFGNEINSGLLTLLTSAVILKFPLRFSTLTSYTSTKFI